MLQILPDQMRNRSMDTLTDHDDLLRKFKIFLNQSREASLSEVSEIEGNWKYYWGQHYLRKMGGKYVADTSGGDKLRIQRDIIQLTVDALRPILVKMRPIILALASYPDRNSRLELDDRTYVIPDLLDSDVCAFITDALKKEHRRRHEDLLLAELVLEVMVTGQAYRAILPVYRPRYGTILEPKLYPRSRIFLDRAGTRLADFRDFKGIAFEDEMTADEILYNYKIPEREYTQNTDADSRMSEYDDSGMFRGVSEFNRYSKNRNLREKQETNDPVYKIHTGYFNEYASETVAYHGTPKERRYPHGRQLVMINEQKIIIDQPNPFWHGDYPLTCYQSLPIPHIARALSEVGKLKDVQKGVNILLNALIGTTLLGMNPKIIYEEGAFNPNDWQGGPGGFVRASRGAVSGKQMDWFQPSGTDRGAYNLLKDLEYYGKEDVAGVTAALQGQELAAGSSGVYANTLQSAAMTGPTFRIEQLNAGHHRFAEQEIELMQQFVDFREPYYALYHDLDQYHPMMPDAMRDVYYRVESESQAELPHNPIARHNFYWNQYLEGIIPFHEYIEKANVSMSPQAREKARRNSMANYMPGIPREIRIELMRMMAQQMANAGQAQNQLGQIAQQQPGQIAGQTPEINDFTSQGIAGDPNQRPM